MAYVSNELSKRVRRELKEKFPRKEGWKFSVRKDSGALTLLVSIMEAPYDFRDEGKEYVQVNHYYPKQHPHPEILKQIIEISMRGNHNNSNAMIDYFDVGWYLHLEIGQWDKPFKFQGGLDLEEKNDTSSQFKESSSYKK